MEGLNRRTFCKTLAAGVAGGTLLGAGATAASAAELTGTVSTRGQYKPSGPTRTIQGVTFDLGVEALDIGPAEVEGSVPGLTDRSSPDDLFVMVHGFSNGPRKAARVFGATANSLDKYGVDGPVVGFSWDAGDEQGDWYAAVNIARLNGRKLAVFLAKYRRASPSTDVHLIGHSLGCQVLLSTARGLAAGGLRVANIALLGAAVDDDAPTLGSADRAPDHPLGDNTTRYGRALGASADEVHNFHLRDDAVLNEEYVLVERNRALGTTTANGRTPPNYSDYPVPFVDGHETYFTPNPSGCMANVKAKLVGE